MLKFIKTFIGGTYLGMANVRIEEQDNPNDARRLLKRAKKFIVSDENKIAYHLVCGKVEYSEGNTNLAKEHYDSACALLKKHPECREWYEFKDTLHKFKNIYGY